MLQRLSSLFPARNPTAVALSRETSLYLDAVRFLAALAVFLGHFGTQDFSGGLFWQIVPFRYDAVVVFFVLSGFVISHAAEKSDRDVWTYIISRAGRMYSVVLPAIAITLICDTLGRWLNPGYYGSPYWLQPLWPQLISSLTFTNQSWLWGGAMVPGSNAPFWSLGYEVPYYAIFGCALFARGAWRFLLPAILLLLAGPGIAVLFPLWLLGVAIHRHRARLSEQWGWVLFLSSIGIWWAIEFWALKTHSWILDDWVPILMHDRIPADYISGLCFGANILGFDAIAHRFAALLGRAAGLIRRAAGMSFSLYLTHYPVMTLCIALSPWGVSAPFTRILCLTAASLVAIVAAQLFERRKEAWRRFFTALVTALRTGVADLRQRLARPATTPSVAPTPLARETSLYLDAVRFIAAVVVFLGHFSMQNISGGMAWQLGLYGHDAVVVFFVLSGFVIAHATMRGERNLSTYIVNRAARIYSVAVPAIAITLLCDALGGRIDPHYFDWAYSTGSLWQQLVTSLTFTNQFWNAAFVPGSDVPYWSLGYEVPYYAIFACAIFARGVWRIVLPVALLLVAGPWIAALFPLWLIGVGLYRLGRRWRASETAGWVLFLGSIAIWTAIEAWLFWRNGGVAPVLPLDRLPTDYLTGICFSLNILGFEAIAHRWTAGLNRMARVIRYAAGRTFTLYLVHYPVMKLFAALEPEHVGSWQTRIFVLCATAAIILIAGELFERPKDAWRRLFMRLVPADRRVAVIH